MYQHHIFEMAETIAKNLQTAYGLPVEAAMIIDPLREYWERYAVHIWSVEDVISQANLHGWPMCEADALEILADLEDRADGESGITWQVLGDVVDTWCESIRWAELGDGLMRAFKGHFIIKAEDHFVQVSGTLLDAIEAARALAARCRAEADVISVADDLVGELNAWRYGHNLLTIHPEE